MKFLIDGFKGSVLKNISKEYLTNLKIPIPKSQEKINEWVDKISLPYNEKNEKQLKIKKLETFVQNRIKEIGENEECDIVELGSICDFQNGKNIIKDNLIKGDYPVIGGGQKPMGFHNEYNTQENVILCSSSGAYAGFINKYNKKTWASDCFSIIPKNNLINNIYLYNFLKTIQQNIYKYQLGSAQPHIYSKDLKSMKIPIPKNKELITDLESVFAEIEELQGDVRQAEELYKQLIQELSDEAIPPISELTEDNIKILNKDDKVDDTPSVKSNSSTKSTLSDLKKECKTLGIKGYSKKNKAELTKMIQDFNTT